MSTENKKQSAVDPFDMDAVKQKLGTLDDKFEYLNKLPAEVRRRLKGLEYYEGKHDELDRQFRDELLNLERKYFQLRKPLYAKRSEIVQGIREPTEEEIVLDSEDEGADRIEEVGKGSVKGIPEFWLHVLKNHPAIGDLITPEDEAALKHLQDIEITYLDTPGYKIEFKFGENEYFDNSVLTKTYYLRNCDSGELDDIIYDHAEGTVINWKDQKNLCVKVVTKTQRKRGSSAVRTVRKTVACESFFNFFCPPEIPAEDEEMSDNEAEELDGRLEADFELGEIMKTKIVSRALDWYTGQAVELEEGFDGEDFDEDDEHEHGEHCDHGNHDDDDDDDLSPIEQQGGSNQQKPECKQQ